MTIKAYEKTNGEWHGVGCDEFSGVELGYWLAGMDESFLIEITGTPNEIGVLAKSIKHHAPYGIRLSETQKRIDTTMDKRRKACVLIRYNNGGMEFVWGKVPNNTPWKE